MKGKVVVVLIALFGLLVLVALLFDRAEERRLARAGGRLFPGFDPAQAVKLTVKTKDGSAALEKKEGGWRVTPEGFAADETGVKAALEKLARLEKGEVSSSNPAKHATLEVDEASATEVQVWTAASGGKPAVHLLIGKTGSDFQSNFVRLAGDPQVYRSGESLRGDFDRGGRGWRDRTVLKLPPAEVTRIELDAAAGQVVLERDATAGGQEGGEWRLTAPEAGPAERYAVDTILRTAEDLQADDFAAIDLAAAGLDAPQHRIAFTLRDGRKVELLWGKDAPEGGRIYAKRADGDAVFQLAAYRKTALLPGLEQLRPKSPAPAEGAGAIPEPSPAVSP